MSEQSSWIFFISTNIGSPSVFARSRSAQYFCGIPRSSPILSLFKKDLLLEIRQQYAFYGVVLYIGATIFVLYMALEAPESRVWNGLFWVVQLFICINAVAKSFLQEAPGRMLYYHTLVSPLHFVLAKLLFNALLMLLMSALSYGLFALFLEHPVLRPAPFFGLVLLGGLSLSLVFTFLAAIAARAQQNAAIMAILGFPIIIPQLVLLMKISLSVFSATGVIPLAPILLLVVMDLLVILLAGILFPFLWKD
ncbi:MAG: cytochrome C biogenesis protein [Chitinophagaceae bacterium]|nr:MAG: cytochrome C biogenesis protein [Chitinophagaceae bacterium]